jgi:hypothetical protein
VCRTFLFRAICPVLVHHPPQGRPEVRQKPSVNGGDRRTTAWHNRQRHQNMWKHRRRFAHRSSGCSCQCRDFIGSLSYPSSASIGHLEFGRILTSSDGNDLVSINNENTRVRPRFVCLAKFNECHVVHI